MPANKSPFKAQHVAGLAVLSIITLIGFASPFLPADVTAGLTPWLAAAKANAWAPLAAMFGFAVFASLGVPQIVLITAVVAVFGPWLGLVYAWTGKMAACSLGFVVGRRFGARIVAANAGPRLSEFMRMLAKRGFAVSALIRLVPTLPSVLINIAAGATPIRFRDFLAGTALGSVPKMALMAFGGAAAMEAMRADSIWPWVVLGAVLLLWALLAWRARKWMRAAKQSESL